jgi:hypothetical protein
MLPNRSHGDSREINLRESDLRERDLLQNDSRERDWLQNSPASKLSSVKTLQRQSHSSGKPKMWQNRRGKSYSSTALEPKQFPLDLIALV